jgi:hypothetical protein
MNNVSPLCKVAVVGLLVVLLSGCAHSLMKGSPFYTGSVMVGIAKGGEKVHWDDPEAAEVKEITLADVGGAELAADRVNVWPLFYQNFLITSILWPMIEINDVGWEVRPLVSVDRYRQEYRVLLGGYHGQDGAHYCFPLYWLGQDDFRSLLYVQDGSKHVVPPLMSYWNKDRFGILFPLSDFDTATGRSHIFPVYCRTQDNVYSLLYSRANDTHVIPILSSYWRTVEGGRQFGVLYPMSDFDTATGSSHIFPLYGRSKGNVYSLLYCRADDTHVIPVLSSYWRTVEGGRQFGVLYPMSDFDTATGESHVLPIYVKDEDGWYTLLAGSGKDFRYVLPPLLIMTGTDGDEPGYHACWPLFSLTPAEKKCYSFPLFSYSGQTDPDGDWSFNYLMPLGWTGREGSTTHAVFFPLFGYESDEMLLTPLGGWVDDGDTVLVAPPLYIRDRDSRETDHNILWPLGNLRLADREKDPAAAAIQGHFFPLFAYYRRDGYQSRTFLFPFYHDGEERTDDGTQSWRCCLPFHYGYEDPKYRHMNWGMLAGAKTETIADEPHSSAYLLPFYYHDWEAEATYTQDEATKEWVRHETAVETRFILPGILTSSNAAKKTSSLTVLPVYSGHREGDRTSHSSLLWLFTRKADLAAGTVNAQALWYLVSYDRQAATEDLPASTNTRILWKLYHRERRGDDVNLDIFPFVACSRSPEHTRLSFAWRFFSVDRSPDATRVHLLFLPVWW